MFKISFDLFVVQKNMSRYNFYLNELEDYSHHKKLKLLEWKRIDSKIKLLSYQNYPRSLHKF